MMPNLVSNYIVSSSAFLPILSAPKHVVDLRKQVLNRRTCMRRAVCAKMTVLVMSSETVPKAGADATVSLSLLGTIRLIQQA